MKKIFISSVIFLCLSGCASNLAFVHPNKTVEEFEKDKSECIYEAEKFGYIPLSLTNSSLVTSIEVSIRKQDLFFKCMAVKGYKVTRKSDQ